MRWIAALAATLLGATVLAAVRSDSGSFPVVDPLPGRTLVVGDSITVDVAREARWPPHVVVMAAGGQQAWGITPAIVPATAAYLDGQGPDLDQLSRVVLMLGTNDWWRRVPVGLFRQAYAQTVVGAAVVTRVYCVLPLPRQDDDGRLQHYVAAIGSVCPAVLDPREVVPAWSEAQYRDRAHLTPEASRMLGDWLARSIAVREAGQ